MTLCTIFRILASHMRFDAYFLVAIRPLQDWLVSRWNHIQRSKSISFGYTTGYSSSDNSEYDVISWIVQREINCRRFLIAKAMFPGIKLYAFHINDIDQVVNSNFSKCKNNNLKSIFQKLFPSLFLTSFHNKTNNFATNNNYEKYPKAVMNAIERLDLTKYDRSLVLPTSHFSKVYSTYHSNSLMATERRALFSM